MANGFKALLNTELLLLPFLIYSAVKLFIPLKNNANLVNKFFRCCLQILVTLLLTPLVLTGIFILACYLELVIILAKIYFGKSYHDSVGGADVIFSFKNPTCKNNIHVVQFVKPDGDTPDKLLQMFRDPKIMDVVLSNYPRFSCVRKSFLGYTFFIKVNVDYKKIIRFFDDYETLEEFQKLTHLATEANLPYNDEYAWEVLIGKKQIQVHTDKFYYPLMYRVHHSTVDGIGLTKFLFSFEKNGIDQLRMEYKEYNRIFAKYQKDNKHFTFKNLINKSRTFLNEKMHYHYDMIFSKEHCSVLNSKFTGKKIITFSFEEQGENLIEKIKKIKNTLKVAYGDVVLSAVSASLSQYYKNNDDNPPMTVTSLNPIYTVSEKLNETLSNKTTGDFGNKFTVGMIELPVDVKLEGNFLEIITRVNAESKSLQSAIDLLFCSWLFKVFLTVAPKPIAQITVARLQGTLIVTNVPGIKKFVLINDCQVEDIVFWGNNFQQVGVVFSIFTFDNRIRLTTHVDQGLINNIQDVQELGDSVLQNIRVFYKHICIEKH